MRVPAVAANQISISEGSAYNDPITLEMLTSAQDCSGVREDPRFHGTQATDAGGSVGRLAVSSKLRSERDSQQATESRRSRGLDWRPQRTRTIRI